MSQGVIYVATGKEFINEACRSAKSLKQQMPFMPVTLFSNEAVETQDIFEQVIIIDQPRYEFIDKIRYMARSPYEKTLFLDTDTYICADVADLFVLLDVFDLAVAHSPLRMTSIASDPLTPYILENVPASFAELNTGVILYRNTPTVQQFFDQWLDVYMKQTAQPIRPEHDQPAFREALYHSKLRISILTPEYNCRFIFPVFVDHTVKILHGRHVDITTISHEINKETTPRLFFQWDMMRRPDWPALLQQMQTENVVRCYIFWDLQALKQLQQQWIDLEQETIRLRDTIRMLQSDPSFLLRTLWLSIISGVRAFLRIFRR